MILKTIKTLSIIVAALSLSCFVALRAVAVLDAPDQHVSYSTKKCVKIVTIDGQELPCSAAKNFKYLNHVWVQ